MMSGVVVQAVRDTPPASSSGSQPPARALTMTATASKTLEFFFDFGSPTTGLAQTPLPRIAREAGATLVYRPMRLGGVFKANGNASPVSVPAKGRWMGADIARWAQRWGVPFAFNPHCPVKTLTLMRGAAGLQMRQLEAFGRDVDAVFEAMWARPRDLGDAATLAALLAEAGFEAAAFTTLVADPELKAKRVANIDEAVARGAFGAPRLLCRRTDALRPGPAGLRARSPGLSTCRQTRLDC
jgi:2-hydroxychromene-2-carboxylate isomerase